MTVQPVLDRSPVLAFTEPHTCQGEVAPEHVRLRELQMQTIADAPPEVAPPLPPEEWLRRITFACLEVVHGRRNVQQLKSIVSPRVSQTLSIRHTVQSRRATQATQIRVGRIRTAQPQSRALEVSTTFTIDQKSYPMALRLELAAIGWKITACDIGPH